MGGMIMPAPNTGSVADDVLVARAFLSRVAEPANIPLWAFVRAEGPVAAVAAILEGRADEDVLAAAGPRALQAEPMADLDAAERRGIRLITPESEEWPHFALICLEHAGARRVSEWRGGKRVIAEHGEPIPPLALWARGDGELSCLGMRSVGIVGSRASTRYGEQVAATLGSDLAERAFTVVSGGAYGIDAAAHRGALAAAGDTVLVSAGGLDRPYPNGNDRLFDQVAASGLLISESPPGSVPKRRRFLTRNRLIAAFSTGTVVVEAATRSGAMNTAGHCFRLGRPIMAVPGPVMSAASAGCHKLLADETAPARLVTSAADVVAIIGSSSDASSLATDPAGVAARSASGVDHFRARLDALDERARQLFEALRPRRFCGVDELAVVAGLPALDVMRALPTLQLNDLVESAGAGHRLSRSARDAVSSR